RIIEAGHHAPTGSNSQNVHYLLVTGETARDTLRTMTIAFYEKLFARLRSPLGRTAIRLAAGNGTVNRLLEYRPIVTHARQLLAKGDDRLFYGAPALLLVHAEAGDTCSAFNCAVALYNCSLMAHTLGVGCCFNGFLEAAVMNDRSLRKWLGLPIGHRCFGAMTMGYQDMRYRKLVKRAAPSVRRL
ncbi:nitroreductase family protein, partial [bacterium]|nr:nitroreductase family protein [candidate division CSSED10-310 bacterium]